MDILKSTLAFWKRLRNNEIDHGDIFAYRLVPIMSKFLFWWTDEDYKKVKKWIKVVYWALSIRITTCMILSLWFLGMHWKNKPIPIVLQDGAICLAALMGSCGSFIFPYFRERTSELLKTINEFNLGVLKRKHNSLENRATSNRLFLILSYLCAVFEVSALITFLLFAWQFLETGEPQFNSFLYEPEPYSVMAFVDEVQFWIPGFWIMYLCTYYMCMYIEFITRITFHFRVLAEEMRQLRRGIDFDEEQELQKLKSLIKDLNLLYWCVDEFNETLRIYIIIYFWLAFTTFGVYAAVILSMGSILDTWQFLFFPLYLLSFIVVLCIIGQHLKDSADQIRDGIYDCDWYTAPAPFRKLVLNVLTRCTHETLFSAEPFYDVDLLLLMRVFKTTYSLLAVFRNAFT